MLCPSYCLLPVSLCRSPSGLVLRSLFGRDVRGPLKLLKEMLLLQEGGVARPIPEYVQNLRARLQQACTLAKNSLASSQAKMKRHYDRKATSPSFQPGDKVLIISHLPGTSLSAKFSGPYLIEKQVNETNFVVQTPERRRKSRLCHVNMMKPYHLRTEGGGTSSCSTKSGVTLPVCVSTGTHAEEDGLILRGAEPQGVRLKNSELLSDLSQFLSHLSRDHWKDVENLLSNFSCLFNDVPSQTTAIEHDIVLTNPRPIKQHAYWVSPAKRESMQKEVDYLVEHGFAVPSLRRFLTSSRCFPNT